MLRPRFTPKSIVLIQREAHSNKAAIRYIGTGSSVVVYAGLKKLSKWSVRPVNCVECMAKNPVVLDSERLRMVVGVEGGAA
jgi:hypothetical protein